MDPSVYRPRRPAETPLYALLESLFETVKGAWEDLFERGFARIRCPKCATEFLLAFSFKSRGLRPSCGAKRAAEFAAFLQDEVVADVGHAQWVFTVPKLLRPYFMHHRELLGSRLLDEDRTRLLLSWHHSGFSVHNLVTVPAGDGGALEALARYCLRVSLVGRPSPRMGSAPSQGLRDRSAGLPPLPRRDAGGRLHHRGPRHPPHPRPPWRLGSPRTPGPRSTSRNCRGSRFHLIPLTGPEPAPAARRRRQGGAMSRPRPDAQ